MYTDEKPAQHFALALLLGLIFTGIFFSLGDAFDKECGFDDNIRKEWTT